MADYAFPVAGTDACSVATLALQVAALGIFAISAVALVTMVPASLRWQRSHWRRSRRAWLFSDLHFWRGFLSNLPDEDAELERARLTMRKHLLVFFGCMGSVVAVFGCVVPLIFLCPD